MKIRAILILATCFSSFTSGFSQQLTSGGIQNAGNPSPATISLNLVYGLMDAAMFTIKDYFDSHHQCPPANHIFRQTNNLTLSNGPYCDVIVNFNSKNTGVLSGKTIRLLIKNGSTTPENIDFSFRQAITNIDYGSNGTAPSFLLKPQRPFSYSYTMMQSQFGNVPSADLASVLQKTYEEILAYAAAANSSSSSTSSGGSSNTTTINSV